MSFSRFQLVIIFERQGAPRVRPGVIFIFFKRAFKCGLDLVKRCPRLVQGMAQRGVKDKWYLR
jgi:hypothetical protein